MFKGVFTPQKWDVFISYSSKDKNTINNIIADLKAYNVAYWVDFEHIKPGDSIIGKIEHGLANSKNVLLCYSHNQLESGWCRAEYESALFDILSEKGTMKKVLPFIIDNTGHKKLPGLVRNRKCIWYSDDEGYQKLLDFLTGKI